MASSWRNLKNIFSRPLFTIIFRPKILILDTDSILRVKPRYESVRSVKLVSWHICYRAGCSLQHAWQSWKLWNTSKTRCKIWRFGYRRIFHSKDPLSNFQNPNFGSKSSCTFRAAKNSFSQKNGNTPKNFNKHKKIWFLRNDTMPKKILLCPINWGTQWTIKISSSE